MVAENNCEYVVRRKGNTLSALAAETVLFSFKKK